MGRASIRCQIRTFLDLVYPPSCLHCDALIQNGVLLCPECLENLSFLTLEGHCAKCFSPISMMSGVCKSCRKISHPFRKLASCFDGYGSGISLSRAYVHSGQGYLAKEIASYIVVQLDQLRFPHFETITSVPTYFNHPLTPIGNELAHLLGCRYIPLLKRHFVPSPCFSLKNGCNIINQNVLLLDMCMQTPATIRSAGWALDEGNPENIYGMTFCATL